MMETVRDKNNKKKVLFLVFSLCFLILIMSSVSAVFWACFDDGAEINFCNPRTPDRTCDSSTGCIYCMSSYNETQQCYNQGNLNACNSIPYECANIGNGSNIDSKAPNLSVTSPIDDFVYAEKSVLVTMKTNEWSDMAYLDLFDDRGRWTQVCNGCSFYNRSRNFHEGLNHVMFRAVDGNENTAYVNKSFFIDTKKPKISKTLPKKNDFAAGNFYLKFKEANPEDIMITYGNDVSGWRTRAINIESCSYDEKGNYECDVYYNLNAYDNEIIDYYFNVTDIAGTSDTRKTTNVRVDTTFPVINYLHYSIDETRVSFNISIIEENFEEISYIDNSAFRPRWRTLCGSLKDGSCIKKVGFSEGEHSVDIQVLDEAGNSIATHLDIEIA